MPAAVAKGIIISISIIAALSIAVLENPQVQSWLEEQRRKIAELLRSVGQDLDPESRRRAEAFAFEGRTTVGNEELPRKSSPDLDAVARATGRSISSASTVRRIPVKGPQDPGEAEERKRKGREYLAQREQQMVELQERRKASNPQASTSPLTPTSFDAMVDSDGNLRDVPLGEKELPLPPIPPPIPEKVELEMKEVERHLQQPILIGESSAVGTSGWQTGSEVANPFGDEYALERSITPRPASPHGESTESAAAFEPAIPGSYPLPQQNSVPRQTDDEGLTYEEQLAIAMSLSEQESVASAATLRHRSAKEDADLHKAIQESLRDLDVQQAAHAVAHAEIPMRDSSDLVDLTPELPQATMPQPWKWESGLGWNIIPTQASPSSAFPRAPPSESTDELYSITPELTRARLATFDAQQNAPGSASGVQGRPFNHFEGTAAQPMPEAAQASFFSAASVISPPPSSRTLDSQTPQLVDVSEEIPHDGAQTPRSRAFSPTSFHSAFHSETIGSDSAPASRAESNARSELSAAEVVELEDDSDVDMLSEEGDGIMTPDSWSEVGSRDTESEAGEHGRSSPAAS